MPKNRSYPTLPRVPIEQAVLSEVLARVTLRLLQIEYHKCRADPQLLVVPFDSLYLRLSANRFGMLSTAIAAYLRDRQTTGCTAREWRDRLIVRARLAEHNRRIGLPWKPVP